MYRQFFKRFIDIIISIPAIIILIPLFIIVTIIIRIESPGNAIYKQVRIGYKGKKFTIYKFRTMFINMNINNLDYTLVNDSRITNLGYYLRKYSIDELPQLFNVLKGDMSIVGFRPGIESNYKDLSFEDIIFSVKPGITGYAQVNGRSNIDLDTKRYWERKYSNDISFITDVKIVLKTIKNFLNTKGAF